MAFCLSDIILHNCVDIEESDRLMKIRQLSKEDWKEYWRLRLIALKNHPEAFGASYDDYVLQTDEYLYDRFTNSYLSPAEESVIFGAFDGTQLVGVMGIAREKNRKQRHKATVWGVFVDDAYRGQGVAKNLMSEVVQLGEKWDGVLQLMLSAEKNNTAAINLYLSFGFVEYGVEPRFSMVDGIFYDELYMIKYLDRTSENFD